MNRGIYAVANGMVTSQQMMDMLANNLANINTTGFKQDGLAVGAPFMQVLAASGGGGPIIGSIGAGPTATQQFADMTPGSMAATGNPLDMAINGPNAMFAVQVDGPNGSSVHYTRAGSFTLDANGELVTPQGYPVLDERGSPIELPPGDVQIGQDGSISVNGKSLKSQIGIYSGTFQKLDPNLFDSTDAQAVNGNANAPTLKQGFIEQSNVNPIETMVSLIEISRNFDMSQKSIQSQDKGMQTLLQAAGG